MKRKTFQLSPAPRNVKFKCKRCGKIWSEIVTWWHMVVCVKCRSDVYQLDAIEVTSPNSGEILRKRLTTK